MGSGAGYSSPRIYHLTWESYRRGSALAHGKFLLDTCKPNCAQGGYWVNARAYFFGVYFHRGPGYNFGNVKVTYWDSHNHGKQHTFRAWIDSEGSWDWR